MRRRIIIGILLALLLVAGFFTARPAWRVFKRWRAGQLAAQAEAAMARGDWPLAGEKAHAAFLLSRSQPDALRSIAKVFAHEGNGGALQFWQQLEHDGDATPADRRDMAEFAIRNGSLEFAAEKLQGLLEESPDLPQHLWLASQFFAASADKPRAVDFSARAVAADPQNRRYQLFHASLLFDSPDSPDVQEQSRATVWSVARDNSAAGFEAIVFLARRADLTTAEMEELISLLKAHASPGTRGEFLALEMRLRSEPAQRNALLEEAVAHYRGSDAEARQQFAVWLNQRGEFGRTLALLTLEDALTRGDWFLAHADALAGLGEWEKLKGELNTPRVPAAPVYLEAFHARCATKLESTNAAELRWQASLRAAGRSPDQLLWLAGYAERNGAVRTARRALREMIGCVADARPVYVSLERLTEKTGTSAELLELFSEMAGRWPEDDAVRNDLAYLNALLSRDVASARAAGEELVKKNPGNLAHRTTLALALLRQKDAAAALRAYDAREFDWKKAMPAHRAVFAAVLAANGRDAEARDHAHRIARERLRDEEFELIEPLL